MTEIGNSIFAGLVFGLLFGLYSAVRIGVLYAIVAGAISGVLFGLLACSFRGMRNFMFRFAFPFLFCLCPAVAFANDTFVSTCGSDNADGSKARPFRTIKKAAAVAKPGDTVYIEPGTYAEDNIVPNSGNAANGMIYFKPAEGKGTVIITHPRTDVALPPAKDASGHWIQITAGTPIFQLYQRHYIWIEGFIFKDYQFSGVTFNIDQGTNNVILNNEFLNIGNGYWQAGDHAIVRLNRSENNVIRNNKFDTFAGSCAYLHSSDYFNIFSENSFTNIKGKSTSNDRGEFSGMSVLIGCQSTYPENGTKADGDNVIAFNYAYNCAGQLHWFDRNGSGAVILRNEVYTVQSLFFNESRCVRNWVYENVAANTSSWAYESANYNTGHTEDARIINNMIYNCRDGIKIDKSWRDEVRNNIVYNNDRAQSIACRFVNFALDQGPHIFRNNLWFTQKANTPGPFEYGSNSTQGSHPPIARVNYASFSGWIGEKGGITAAPTFVDADNKDRTQRNYGLAPRSAGAGAGDTGLNLGPYAVYPKIPVGYNPDLPITGNIVVSFAASPVSPSSGKNKSGQTVKRGKPHTLTLTLNKTQNRATTVKIVPIAGDSRNNIDFEMVGGTKVTIPANQKTADVTVNFKGYAAYDQLIAFRLQNAVNADIGGRNLHVVRVGKTVNAGADELKVLAPGAKTFTWQPAAPEVNGVPPGSSYAWSLEDGTVLSTKLNAAIPLSKGVHRLFLNVTVPGAGTWSDDVVITVVKKADIWLEAERGVLGDLWMVKEDTRASGGKYVTTPPGKIGENTTAGPTVITFNFNVEEEGYYYLWVRVNHRDGIADSYFEGVKGALAPPKDWDIGSTGNNWHWKRKTGPYYLRTGANTFWMAKRGAEANLDKILFPNAGTDPSVTGQKGEGANDNNYGGDASN